VIGALTGLVTGAVGAPTGGAGGGGQLFTLPGVPLSPELDGHTVVELHQLEPIELSNVAFLNDMEAPAAFGKV
jgi:hypothetical protein